MAERDSLRHDLDEPHACGEQQAPAALRFPCDAMRDAVAELGFKHVEVLGYVLSQRTNVDISRLTGLSINAVKCHISALFLTLDVTSRSELVNLFR